MSNSQSRALRVFDNTTNLPSYPVSTISDQKSGGILTHVPSASKVPTPPIETFFNPSNYIHRSAIDSAYEQKNSGGSRKFAIYPSGAKNTFVYEASVSSKSDFYDDDDSFFSAPDDASVLARSSLETLPSVYSIGQHESDFSDHSPSRIVPPRLPALIEAQNNYNSGVINVALPEGGVIRCVLSTTLTMHYTGSVSSDSDTDSTITEGPYGGQDSTAIHRYYGMMSSRPVPVPEDRRLLPPPVPSQPQPGVITPRAPSISPPTGIVGPTRPPAPVQRLQDPQTPMPRDSLALQPAPSMQRQDSGYGGRAVIPRRSSLEREQRPILPPGLSTSPGHSISGQPPPPSTYTPVRPRRDSLSPPVPPSAQSRRESVSLGPQPSIQPVGWDPISGAVTQPPGPPSRRDSVILAQPPPSIHRNSLAIVTQPPVPVRRATDPLPMGMPPPITPMRRASESGPRGQGTLVSTRVRFNDENLICPSPIPMHERRKGWHNRRGYVSSRPLPMRVKDF